MPLYWLKNQMVLCLVVKNEVASPKDLIEAKKRLSQVGIPLLGSIVIDA